MHLLSSSDHSYLNQQRSPFYPIAFSTMQTKALGGTTQHKHKSHPLATHHPGKHSHDKPCKDVEKQSYFPFLVKESGLITQTIKSCNLSMTKFPNISYVIL